jgi:hypothetical protein
MYLQRKNTRIEKISTHIQHSTWIRSYSASFKRKETARPLLSAKWPTTVGSAVEERTAKDALLMISTTVQSNYLINLFIYIMNRDTSIKINSSLWVGHLWNRCSISRRERDFFLLYAFQSNAGEYLPSYPLTTETFPGSKEAVVRSRPLTPTLRRI